jgi:hypothetical protein
MGALTGQTIAASYEQLLSLPDGGGNGASLVAITDGDAGTTFCISITDASTGKAVLAVDGSHANGTEVQIDNSATDGDAFLSFQLSGTSKFTMGVDDGASDIFKIGTTAIGTGTMFALDTSSRFSLSNNDAGGDYNTIFGKLAGGGLTNGGEEHNTFIGHNVAATGTMTATADKNTGVGAWVLNDLTTGASNVGVGYDALAKLTEGEDNVAIGALALDANETGDLNVGIGSSALSAYIGNAAIAIGREALRDLNHADALGTIGIGQGAGASLTSGIGNVAIGYQALDAEDTGDYCVAVGHQSLSAQNTDGTMANVAVGYQAASGLTSATGTTAIGYKAGGSATMTGAVNTLVGSQAGTALIGGDSNVIIGADTGVALTSGSSNVVIGKGALDVATTATLNVVVGTDAMGSVPAGQDVRKIVAVGELALFGAGGTNTGIDGTVAIGYSALKALTTGAENTAVGYLALEDMTTGSANVAIGYQSQLNINHADADSNVTVGAFTMDGVAAVAVHSCTAVGHNALSGALTTGAVGSTAIGFNSLNALTSGGSNTAVGYQSLRDQDAGASNTAIGHHSLIVATGSDAAENTAVGALSGDAISSGQKNTIVGSEAAANRLTSGDKNTAIGAETLGKAGGSNLTGDSNTCLGFQAGVSLAGAAASNTLIGATASVGGTDLTTGSNNIIIGSGSGVNSATAASRIVIGTGLASAASGNTTLYIGDNTNYLSYAYTGSGNVTISSDVRTKKNIRDTDLGLDFVNQLRPVKYNMRYPKDWADGLAGEDPNDYGEDYDKDEWDGFIAQEVKAAMDSSGVSFSGWEVEANDRFENPRQRLAYSQFVVPLVKAVQELSAKVKALEDAQ